MRYEEAYAAASRKLGNQTSIREEIYNMNSIPLLDTMARDLKHGFRVLRRSPTFTAAALLTLTLGISASTLVSSLMNSILLKPLPYPNPEQLVAVRQLAPGAAGLESVSDGLLLSRSMYFTYAEHNRAFQSLGV
jgi:pilus assembly protein TadC